jgi:hypothetical protein
MLRHPVTQGALNKGDVPYWTRQGNTVFGEDGVQQVAALAHPRLDTIANIATDANNRRTQPLPLPDQRLHLLHQQVIPAYANISAGIINEHQMLRQADGYGAPNY